MTQDELRLAILDFDINRAKTSLNAVQGVITREQADARLEFDVASLLDDIDKYAAEKILEELIAELEDIEGGFDACKTAFDYGILSGLIAKNRTSRQAELAQLRKKDNVS